MASPALRACRFAGCTFEATNLKAGDLFCLDHFLEKMFASASQAFERCRQGQPIDPQELQKLLDDARVVSQTLIGNPEHSAPAQRDKLLELLLCLSNLQEYVWHHEVRLPVRE